MESQVIETNRIICGAAKAVNRGWLLRNVLIWHKPNPMPSSAKDRFTVDFEYVYFFVKSKRYWFEPQHEAVKESSVQRNKYIENSKNQPYAVSRNREPGEFCNPLGRNKRAVWTLPDEIGWHNLLEVLSKEFGSPLKSLAALQRAGLLPNNIKPTTWTIPTQSFAEAHFATFPEKLVEPMILSGCPEFVCTKCGKGREKVYDLGEMKAGRKQDAQYAKNALHKDLRTKRDKGWNTEDKFCPGMFYEKRFKGYSDCGCGAEHRPGIVLDPFVVRARPVWSLPKTEGIGLGLSLNRNISKWRNAA